LANPTLTLPRQVTTHPANDQEPALNRDGTKLLYVSHKSDPRGDVYLLDLVTGEEQRLTDLSSGDAFPQWDAQEEAFFYVKRNPLLNTSGVYRKSISTPSEELLVPEATSFSINGQGQLLYSNGTHLTLMDLQNGGSTALDPEGEELDLWPALAQAAPDSGTLQLLYFSRYERDTNGDGRIDTDDESSIWMRQWEPQQASFHSLYRITPAQQFHIYPAVSGD